MCLSALYPFLDADTDMLLAFAASSEPDTMYYHQAMNETDAPHFIKAMVEKINGQMRNNNFVVIPRSEVPEGASL